MAIGNSILYFIAYEFLMFLFNVGDKLKDIGPNCFLIEGKYLSRIFIWHFIYLYFLQVSWIRRRDWSILSSGNSAFTKDARFSLLHRPGDSDWTLIIKYLQKRDEGTYVCQVCHVATFTLKNVIRDGFGTSFRKNFLGVNFDDFSK